jgi:hypothetical protein
MVGCGGGMSCIYLLWTSASGHGRESEAGSPPACDVEGDHELSAASSYRPNTFIYMCATEDDSICCCSTTVVMLAIVNVQLPDQKSRAVSERCPKYAKVGNNRGLYQASASNEALPSRAINHQLQYAPTTALPLDLSRLYLWMSANPMTVEHHYTAFNKISSRIPLDSAQVHPTARFLRLRLPSHSLELEKRND